MIALEIVIAISEFCTSVFRMSGALGLLVDFSFFVSRLKGLYEAYGLQIIDTSLKRHFASIIRHRPM